MKASDKKKPMKCVAFHCETTLYERLRKAASVENRSVAGMIRHYILEGLSK